MSSEKRLFFFVISIDFSIKFSSSLKVNPTSSFSKNLLKGSSFSFSSFSFSLAFLSKFSNSCFCFSESSSINLFFSFLNSFFLFFSSGTFLNSLELFWNNRLKKETKFKERNKILSLLFQIQLANLILL